MQVDLESVRKVEDQNMKIMRNIKRLRQAVQQFETRVDQMRAMNTTLKKKRQEGAGMMMIL